MQTSKFKRDDGLNWIFGNLKPLWHLKLCSATMKNPRGNGWKLENDFQCGRFLSLMILPCHYSCDLMMCQIWKSALRLLGALNTHTMTQTGRKKPEIGRLLTVMASTDTDAAALGLRRAPHGCGRRGTQRTGFQRATKSPISCRFYGATEGKCASPFHMCHKRSHRSNMCHGYFSLALLQGPVAHCPCW